MKRISLFALALVVGLAVLLSAHSPASAKGAMGGKKHNILLQWTEGDSLGQLIMTKHVGNLLGDLGDAHVNLEVIAYGFATPVVTSNNPKSYFQDDIR